MMKRIAPACVALLAGLTMAACGSSNESSSTDTGTATQAAAAVTAADKPVKVGLLVPSTTNEFWNTLTAGAKAEAAKMPGVELIVQASDDDADVEGGIAKLQAFQTKGVDAVVAVAYLGEPMKSTFERMAADGTPIVFVDTKVPGWDGETSFIATDNLKGGQIAGDYLKELTGGSGTVAFIECSQQYESCRQRVSGAKDKLAGTDVKIAGPLDGGCNRNTTVSVTQDMLTANPDMKVIYAGCGQSALAASLALSRAGRDDIKVLGFDGASQELDAIEAGTQLATIAQFPLKMGELGVRNAVLAARGEPVEKSIDSGQELVTKDNVAAFIAENSAPE
jgi:simple sugar transport system substrate-binding protein